MPYQNIDATLSAADMQAVKDAFAAVLTKLPFLVNLTVDERKSIVNCSESAFSASGRFIVMIAVFSFNSYLTVSNIFFCCESHE